MKGPGEGDSSARLPTRQRSGLAGVAAGVALQAASLLLTFVNGLLLARWLGASGLGVYAYTLAVVGVASVVAAMGWPAATLRFAAQYHHRNDPLSLRGLLRLGSGMTGILAGLAGLGMLGWAFARLHASPKLAAVVIVASPLPLLLSLTQLRLRTLQAFGRPVLAQIPDKLVKPATFLAGLGLLWAVGREVDLSPTVAMGIWVTTVALAFAVGTGFLRRVLGRTRASPSERPVYRVREWTTTAGSLAIADSFGLIYGYIDILLLGVMATGAAVGRYQVAVRMSTLLLVLLTASNVVIAPTISRLYLDDDRVRLQRLVTRASRWVFAGTLVAFLGYAFAGRALLGSLFGPDYVGAFVPLLIISAGRLVDVACGPVTLLQQMTGGQRLISRAVGAGALLNLAGCAALIPRFGIDGAAASTAFSVAAVNVALAILGGNRIGVRPTILGFL